MSAIALTVTPVRVRLRFISPMGATVSAIAVVSWIRAALAAELGHSRRSPLTPAATVRTSDFSTRAGV
jgi:hypothetical protein